MVEQPLQAQTTSSRPKKTLIMIETFRFALIKEQKLCQCSRNYPEHSFQALESKTWNTSNLRK
jgi:hypothetical protein